MKKIFFLLICACIALCIFGEQSYATTAFFTTKDGRVFCESDAFDGSYRLCTKAQSTGTGLIKAERYNARLVETTAGRICVEDGTEVSICPEEPKVAPISTGGIQVPVVATNTSTTASSSAIMTSPIVPPVSPQSSGTVDNTNQPVPQKVVTPTELGLFSSISTMFVSCFGSTGTMSCSKAITKMTDAFVDIGTFSIIGLIVLFFGCTIFWFNMISHAFAHPIPIKPLWIAILLILSVPGAILYYFAALRPYEEMVIASGPPRPPSFFY